LSGSSSTNGFRDDRYERVGILRRAHEQAGPEQGPLREWLINRHVALGHDARVVDIGRDTHDAARSRADVGGLDQRIGPHDVPVDGVLPGEQLLRDALADDDYGFGFLPIGLREITPLEKRNPQRGEVARGNKAEPGTQIVLAALRFSTFDRELQSEP